jgi:hypothetical protein
MFRMQSPRMLHRTVLQVNSRLSEEYLTSNFRVEVCGEDEVRLYRLYMVPLYPHVITTRRHKPKDHNLNVSFVCYPTNYI